MKHFKRIFFSLTLVLFQCPLPNQSHLRITTLMLLALTKPRILWNWLRWVRVLSWNLTNLKESSNPITKRAKSKKRMQIKRGSPARARQHKRVLREIWENERKIFVLKIVLGTLAYALEKASNFPSFRFVCLSLSELWRHSRASLFCFIFVNVKNRLVNLSHQSFFFLREDSTTL